MLKGILSRLIAPAVSALGAWLAAQGFPLSAEELATVEGAAVILCATAAAVGLDYGARKVGGVGGWVLRKLSPRERLELEAPAELREPRAR